MKRTGAHLHVLTQKEHLSKKNPSFRGPNKAEGRFDSLDEFLVWASTSSLDIILKLKVWNGFQLRNKLPNMWTRFAKFGNHQKIRTSENITVKDIRLNHDGRSGFGGLKNKRADREDQVHTRGRRLSWIIDYSINRLSPNTRLILD